MLSYPESVTEDDSLTTPAAALAWLERIAGDWHLLDSLLPHDRQRFHRAIAALSTADKRANRRRRKAARANEVRREEAILDETGIRARRRRPVVTTPNVFPPLSEAESAADAAGPSVNRVCYICKQRYSELHHFYDQLCAECAAINFAARTELADLRGRVALL